MTYDDLKIVTEFLTVVALVITGIWVVYNFNLKRERFPKVEFSLGLRLVGESKDQLILEFLAYIENKGITRHTIDLKTFILKIRYITTADLDKLTNHTELYLKDRLGNKKPFDFFALNFPNSVKPNFVKCSIDRKKDEKNLWMQVLWVPEEWGYIFIDGGTKQKISLPLMISSEAKYILLKSEFKYKDKKSGLHSAQSIFNIDELRTSTQED